MNSILEDEIYRKNTEKNEKTCPLFRAFEFHSIIC